MEDKKRVVGQNGEDHNYGFDDDQALYIHVYHDHVAYRFEVLKVSGRWFRVSKCVGFNVTLDTL